MFGIYVYQAHNIHTLCLDFACSAKTYADAEVIQSLQVIELMITKFPRY